MTVSVHGCLNTVFAESTRKIAVFRDPNSLDCMLAPLLVTPALTMGDRRLHRGSFSVPFVVVVGDIDGVVGLLARVELGGLSRVSV